MTCIADPDQTAQQEPSCQDLQCLSRHQQTHINNTNIVQQILSAHNTMCTTRKLANFADPDQAAQQEPPGQNLQSLPKTQQAHIYKANLVQ